MEEETEYFSFPLKETKKFFARFVRNAVGFGRAVENFLFPEVSDFVELFQRLQRGKKWPAKDASSFELIEMEKDHLVESNVFTAIRGLIERFAIFLSCFLLWLCWYFYMREGARKM